MSRQVQTVYPCFCKAGAGVFSNPRFRLFTFWKLQSTLIKAPLYSSAWLVALLLGSFSRVCKRPRACSSTSSHSASPPLGHSHSSHPVRSSTSSSPVRSARKGFTGTDITSDM